jgi:DNA polymerase-3 subunit epsilon
VTRKYGDKTVPEKLSDLRVLILDCQATTSNPKSGRLLEIGWTLFTPKETEIRQANIQPPQTESTKLNTQEKVETYLLAFPEDEKIPRQVKKITGISEEEIKSGITMEQAWAHLINTINQILTDTHKQTFPTIIHFSQFEVAYLRHLHQEFSPYSTFPFDIICTHKIIKRLLPHLPRKGLRAAAGFLGYSVPESRRCEHHVQATLYIWEKIIPLLQSLKGITSLEELQAWLATPINPTPSLKAKKRCKQYQYPMKQSIRQKLPDCPGIYRMLRSNGDILYIGKAKSLKQRVNSYFQKRTPHAERTLEMLTQAFDLDITITNSALESGLLESDEIKKHSPPYNVALRQSERQVLFFSRNLEQWSDFPDVHHHKGPFISPNAELIKQFPLYLKLLKDNSSITLTDSLCAELLCIPPEYASELECFIEGVNIFREHFFKDTHRSLTLSHFLKLGKELWKIRLEEIEKKKAEKKEMEESLEEEKQDEIAEPKERIWTPEMVSHFIESIILRGTHSIRRARWFNLLSESTLSWKNRDRENLQNLTHILQFSSGKIIDSHLLPSSPNIEIPIPQEHKKSQKERQKSFDVMTYDRMRVLTSELRRLINDENDRQVKLFLSPSKTLRKPQLQKALIWL